MIIVLMMLTKSRENKFLSSTPFIQLAGFPETLTINMLNFIKNFIYTSNTNPELIFGIKPLSIFFK